jgi:hypothetical protein
MQYAVWHNEWQSILTGMIVLFRRICEQNWQKVKSSYAETLYPRLVHSNLFSWPAIAAISCALLPASRGAPLVRKDDLVAYASKPSITITFARDSNIHAMIAASIGTPLPLLTKCRTEAPEKEQILTNIKVALHPAGSSSAGTLLYLSMSNE